MANGSLVAAAASTVVARRNRRWRQRFIHPWTRAARRSTNLDPQRAPERSRGIVRLRTVVTHEDAAVAAITIERAADFSDLSRSCNPARCLHVEISQLLQREIFFFRQKLDAHLGSHVHGGGFRSMLLPYFPPFTIVANAHAALRGFRRTVPKNVFARVFVMTNHVRFTSSSFHFIERPQFFSIGFQLCLDFSPFQTFMAVLVFLKADFQRFEQFFTLLWGQLLFIAFGVVHSLDGGLNSKPVEFDGFKTAIVSSMNPYAFA